MAIDRIGGGAAVEKVLTITPTGIAAVRGLLAQSIVRGDHTGGTLSIDEACQGATCWAVKTSDGKAAMAYAMRPAGKTCWVVAVGGHLPGVDLTKTVLPTMYAQAAAMGCTQIAGTTKRRGMMAKLARAGWAPAATTYRKALKK